MAAQQYIITFFTDFVKILSEMSPYLLLGFFFAGLLYAFVPQQKIEKYFNGKTLKSSVLASVFGIPLPLCSCGVIPTGTALYKNGASKAGTVSFLISTPQTGVDSMLATYSLMGLPFAIIRPLASFVTGITGGLITGVVTKNESETRTFQPQPDTKKTFKQKLVSVFRYGFVDFIQDISKWLVIGLLLAAVVSALIPDNYFNLLNMPPILQMLLILLVSVPMYICATGSIPLATILIMKGISPGAAFVFLMAGPATNAATITMIGKVLGKKSMFAYLGTIVAGALGFGLLIDYVLPIHWFTAIVHNHMAHNHEAGIQWWQIASGVILSLLIINGYLIKFIKNRRNNLTIKTQTDMETKTIKVEGMTCNHCKANVEKNLQMLDFVKTATVNLSDKSVTLEGDKLDLDKIKETIDGLGYKSL